MASSGRSFPRHVDGITTRVFPPSRAFGSHRRIPVPDVRRFERPRSPTTFRNVASRVHHLIHILPTEWKQLHPHHCPFQSYGVARDAIRTRTTRRNRRCNRTGPPCSRGGRFGSCFGVRLCDGTCLRDDGDGDGARLFAIFHAPVLPIASSKKHEGLLEGRDAHGHFRRRRRGRRRGSWRW